RSPAPGWLKLQAVWRAKPSQRFISSQRLKPSQSLLTQASLPRRPGLRSLLSAPDAGRKTPACQSWVFKKPVLSVVSV
ncbi:hypothetical protein RSA30_10715, partial [Pantoea stewartii]